MFLRYRGGGVGHKPIHEATRCLLDDRDRLDQLPFTMEKMHETQDSDEEMTNDGEDNDDPEDEEDAEEEDAMEGSDDEDEDEGSGSCEDSDEEHHEDEDNEGDANQDPHTTEYLIDDDIADEMDEFGYTGLDQVLVEDEDDDALLDDDALGAEDGEEGGLNYDEAEGVGFADL